MFGSGIMTRAPVFAWLTDRSPLKGISTEKDPPNLSWFIFANVSLRLNESVASADPKYFVLRARSVFSMLTTPGLLNDHSLTEF